jgi:short-subunit dehydrogenase
MVGLSAIPDATLAKDREMTAQDTKAKTALVTGASIGIGYELAKLFARDGYDLILVSRDKDKLDAVAAELEASHKCRVAVLAKDLTVPRAPDEIYEQLQQNSVDLDVLVNNAGVGGIGAFHKDDTQRWLDMIQLNVTSLVHLTRLVLPGMVERGRGRVLNVASTAAFQPGPFMATYYATKAFVLSFSEAIDTELKGTGVSVTTVCPGPTRTEFQRRAGMKESKLAKGGVIMDAATVARIGYDAMMKNKRTVVTGTKNRVAAFASSRVLPRSFVLNAVRYLNKDR